MVRWYVDDRVCIEESIRLCCMALSVRGMDLCWNWSSGSPRGEAALSSEQ